MGIVSKGAATRPARGDSCSGLRGKRPKGGGEWGKVSREGVKSLALDAGRSGSRFDDGKTEAWSTVEVFLWGSQRGTGRAGKRRSGRAD